MGIGIIGIALGYIGQNVIQTQVEELQKKPQPVESEEECAPTEIETKEDNHGFLIPMIKSIFMFFFPLVAMVIIGSVIVGHIERWSWVDSFYWCVMTGTSVG